MDIKHITSDSLRRLLSLTTKKEQLIKAVSDVENQIAKTLKGAATTAVEVAEAVTPFKPAKKAKKAGGGRSGGLKDRVLALLEAAGDEGLRVKDIAAKLGSTPGNISVWFSTTGKSLTTKVEPGRYTTKGVKKAAVPTKAAKPAKAKKKSKLSPGGRAKLSAMMKARWADRKAGKPTAAAKKVAKPAKKGFKLPKKS